MFGNLWKFNDNIYGCDSDGDGYSDINDKFSTIPKWLDTDNRWRWKTQMIVFPLDDATQQMDSDGDGFGDNPIGSWMQISFLMITLNGMILTEMVMVII